MALMLRLCCARGYRWSGVANWAAVLMLRAYAASFLSAGCWFASPLLWGAGILDFADWMSLLKSQRADFMDALCCTSLAGRGKKVGWAHR